ncbi:unnamed protein product [Oikopleura dioica]|uniref:EF-hand domain-containing protein n=1 Tax=Oikopleura dioica TaxID=34765 RepID=E4WV52_OIKDI|nr:unnamed protein product [Oikopleura dioica]
MLPRKSSIARITPLEEEFDPNVLKRSKIKDDQYQLLLTDTDGSGSLAKSEVQNLKKAVGKLPGVSNVVVTISGRPHNASGLTGGAIFGVILALVVVAFAGYKGYHKYDLEYYILSILPAKNSSVGPQGDVEITTVSAGVENISYENNEDHEDVTRYDEAIEFESEEVKAARHAPTGFTNPAFGTVDKLSEDSVDDDSNAMLFDIEKVPMVEEHVAVSIDKESERMEQENNEEPSIDTSNDLPAETSVIDNPSSLTDPPPVIHAEENLGIFDVGPISASEAENSTAPAVDLSFLDLSSPAHQEPEGTEPEPVQSGTDQLLDFLS